MVSLAATAATGVILARALGPERLGIYAAVVVTTSLIGALSKFGLDFHLVTVLTGKATDADCYAAVVRTAFVVGAASVAIAEIVSWSALSGQWRTAFMIDLGEVALAPLLLRQVVLQVRFQQRSIVVAQLANRSAWFMAVTFVATLRPSHALAWLMVARVVLPVLQGIILAKLSPFPRRPAPISPARALTDSYHAFRASVPLALSSLLGTGYNRIDQLLLTGLRGPYATGVYAAAVRLAELAQPIPTIAQSVSLPSMVAARQTGDPTESRQALDDALLLTILPGGLAVALLAGVGRPIVLLALGGRFSAATPALVVLAAAEWFRFPGTVYDSYALAFGRRRSIMLANGAGFLLNLGANLALVPVIGVAGAAWASFLAYGTSAFFMARVASSAEPGARSSYALTLRLALASFIPMVIGYFLALPLTPAVLVVGITYLVGVLVLLPRRHRQRALRLVRVAATRLLVTPGALARRRVAR